MEKTVQLFNPHSGQRKIIDGFADTEHKFGIASIGRQWGKSLMAENLLVYWLINNNNTNGGWISPIYSQSKKVYKEIVKACESIITSHNGSDLIINFVNGSSIQFLSAERYDSIRGFSFHYLIVDEAAYIRKEALESAILPTLTAAGRKCLIISTPKGKGNWYYEWYLRGLQQESDYISFEGLSKENPYVDLSFIDEQRKSLPPDIFLQEYEAKFVDGGNDVFTNINEVCILNAFPEPNSSERYYFGIDTGISQDYSVLSILSESGRLHSMVRINGTTIRDIAQQFITEIKRYSNITGFVEINGVGRSMYDEVRRELRTAREFVTTNESKVQGVRSLIEDMQNNILELPSKDLFPELYRELAAFTYKTSPTGKLQFSHPNGMHDDTVMSLMMANQARNQLKVSATSRIYVGQFS